MTSCDELGWAPVVPNAVYTKNKKLVVNFEDLSENENQAFTELRARCSEEFPEEWQQRYLTDHCLLRFLRARSFQTPKSLDMLRTTISWRSEYLSQITPEIVEEESQTGKTYRNGVDKQGRPIIYMRDRRQNTKNFENQVKYTCYQFEKTVLSMDKDKGVSQWALIIDFNGFSFASLCARCVRFALCSLCALCAVRAVRVCAVRVCAVYAVCAVRCALCARDF